MHRRPMKPTVEVDADLHRSSRSWTRAPLMLGVALLMAAGLWLAFHGTSIRNAQIPAVDDTSAPRHESFSHGRKIPQTPEPAANRVAANATPSKQDAAREAALQSAQQNAAMLAAQETAQAAQAAELADKQRELEQVQAAQEAQAKKIADDDARLAQEKASVLQAKLEAEKAAEKVNAGTRAQPAYSGPASGTLVWQGEVKGVTLVTITGSQSDEGRLVSGALPGVLVLLQPTDSKHVVVASPPSPSNRYQRLTLRVQGNGMVQQSIRWSLP